MADTKSSEKYLDLCDAVVVFPQDISLQENHAIMMLIDEVEKRTGIQWETIPNFEIKQRPTIIIGQMPVLLNFIKEHFQMDIFSADFDVAEGYQIRIVFLDYAPTVFVVGNDARGVLFGVGYLLRALIMRRGFILLTKDLSISTSPHYHLRGHQLGYRDKTNSYCGWNLQQWEQYIRDLVVFGSNAIELIPPRSDDKPDSAHFLLPPMDMMVFVSRIADNYGLDVWIWYPALDEDYSNPMTVETALSEWKDVFEKLPRIDGVFVPGGDPGKNPPKYLLSMLEGQARQLKELHPHAQMWLSPQGYRQEWMTDLINYLETEKPEWLAGLVYGPWVPMSLNEFRKLVPTGYVIRNYPDITHSHSCQYPVPEWDLAYALTEGREAINPRPQAQTAIFKHEQPNTIGFITYSEGCHDDINKVIWSSLGWNPSFQTIDILREYGNYFIGSEYGDNFAQILYGLEKNWDGPLACNEDVYITLSQCQLLESSASPHVLKNWRFQLVLYRAYFDAYIRSRLLYEISLEEQAMAVLRQYRDIGSRAAINEAERILDLSVLQPISSQWRVRIFQLAEALFQSIHMQLSVRYYQAQHESRGANLDGLDFPLNNRPWLKEQFERIRNLNNDDQRDGELSELLEWTNPGPGGFYDNLSKINRNSRLAGVQDVSLDPAFMRSPLRKFPIKKTQDAIRLPWRSYTGSLFNSSFEMHYPNLDPTASYKVWIVYSSENIDVKIRLDANKNIEVHPYIFKKVPQGRMEFDIPTEATKEGQLILRWSREPGKGGNGNGCEISEIWLVKSDT